MSVDNRRANIERLMSGGTSDTVAVCEKCGSKHFYSITVEQFSKGFGSVEYQNISTNPKTVRICLCGYPLPVKSNVKGANAIRASQEEFFTSLNGAREFLDNNSASAVVKQAVSPKELEDFTSRLLSEIETLKAQVAALIAADHSKPVKPVKS